MVVATVGNAVERVTFLRRGRNFGLTTMINVSLVVIEDAGDFDAEIKGFIK